MKNFSLYFLYRFRCFDRAMYSGTRWNWRCIKDYNELKFWSKMMMLFLQISCMCNKYLLWSGINTWFDYIWHATYCFVQYWKRNFPCCSLFAFKRWLFFRRQYFIIVWILWMLRTTTITIAKEKHCETKTMTSSHNFIHVIASISPKTLAWAKKNIKCLEFSSFMHHCFECYLYEKTMILLKSFHIQASYWCFQLEWMNDTK